MLLKPYQPKQRYVPKVKKTEESIQLRVATYIKQNYPHVIFSSDTAGLYIKEVGVKKKLKRMNSDRGRPDMHLFYPSRGYHGLCMELKPEGYVIYNKDGSLRKRMVTQKVLTKQGWRITRYDHLQEQADRLTYLNKLGYFARFAIGYEKACRLVDWYMEANTATLF